MTTVGTSGQARGSGFKRSFPKSRSEGKKLEFELACIKSGTSRVLRGNKARYLIAAAVHTISFPYLRHQIIQLDVIGRWGLRSPPWVPNPSLSKDQRSPVSSPRTGLLIGRTVDFTFFSVIVTLLVLCVIVLDV
jgi:hypothetical protein